MAKKQDSFYFDSFVACVEHACKAASILEDTLANFSSDTLKDRWAAIHHEEHEADCKKHVVMEALAKAFITPIEREDIILLCQNVDEMVDKIDDVVMRLYCNNITSIRPDAVKLGKLIQQNCAKVQELMVEFPNFKRSKILREKVIAINSLEEEGDVLFQECLRTLHTQCTDPMEVFAWHEVYIYLEQCLDACEHVADVVESVVMKNS